MKKLYSIYICLAAAVAAMTVSSCGVTGNAVASIGQDYFDGIYYTRPSVDKQKTVASLAAVDSLGSRTRAALNGDIQPVTATQASGRFRMANIDTLKNLTFDEFYDLYGPWGSQT